MFPKIRHIDDVLPYIKDIDEFAVIEKDGYTVIDYLFMGGETFKGETNSLSMNIRKECRGIAFDTNGNIISRPLEKFFNVGEKEETMPENLDWSGDNLVMDKLDGSMLRPLYLEDGFRMGTRKGITDVSILAENLRKAC